MSMGALGREAAEIEAHGANYDAAPLAERGEGGTSWGDDGLFGVFQAAYAECTRIAVAAYGGISADMTGHSDGMRLSIRSIEDADAASRGPGLWV